MPRLAIHRLAIAASSLVFASGPLAEAQWSPVAYQDTYVQNGLFQFDAAVLDTGGGRALLRSVNGGVNIYRLESDASWTLEAAIPAIEPDIAFGRVGCIDDDVAIVCASDWADDEGVVRGRAYAYERDAKSGTWSQTYIFEALDLPAENAGINGYGFGFRAAYEDGLAVISDMRAADGSNSDTGYVRFFERTSPGDWTTSSVYFGLAAEDRFGASLAIQRGLVDLCAVGANQLELPDTNGTIEFFIRSENGAWVPQPDRLIGPGESDWPSDIDLNGTRMAVSGSNQYGLPGIVQIWDGAEDDWVRRTSIIGGGEEKGFFGNTVQLWGNRLLVTQPFTLGLPSDGGAYLYESDDDGEYRLTHAFNGGLNFQSNAGCTARILGDHVLVQNSSNGVADHRREVFQYPPDRPDPPCAGDVNNDGMVDAADLGLLLAAFGMCP